MPPSLRSRDILLLLLAVTTGASDATAFERLGHAFASVITGNLVLLGVGGARGDGQLALFAGCALAGYAIGVIIAAPRRGEHADQGADWPVHATNALIIDLGFLIAFAIGWELTSGRPAHTMQFVLLSIAGAAMGAQSTAVRRLGQLSTTYLTSTLTGLLEALATWRLSGGHLRSIGIIAMAVLGAAAGTALVVYARRLLPLLQLGPLVIVILASRRWIRSPA